MSAAFLDFQMFLAGQKHSMNSGKASGLKSEGGSCAAILERLGFEKCRARGSSQNSAKQ
jgi:hypothetical protein